MAPGSEFRESATSGGPLFVGRDAELTELSRGLEDALGGRGQLFLLSGEPGIGKTRVCDRVARLAEALGMLTFWGRCWEAGGARAYFPWSDVLEGLAEVLDDAELERAVGQGATALAALAPRVSARLPAPRVVSSVEEARLDLYRAVASLVRSAARKSGLSLLFEDLHAADESSLALLRFVARELRGCRAFVLGSFRDVEARLTPPIGEALSQLTREGTTLSLARLAAHETRELVQRRLGERAAPLHETIFRRTQGNPLFIEEMIRLVKSRAELSELPPELPLGVRQVIQQHSSRVPPNVRALLEVAAAGGDEIEPALVAAAAEVGADEMHDGLAQSVEAGILMQSGDGFRFAHALFREVLEAELRPERHRALHASLAAALERRTSFSPHVPFARIAHHLLEGTVDGLERAVGYVLRASEQSLSVFAFEDAIRLLERAGAALERAGGIPLLRGQVLVAMGRARILAGAGGLGQAACLEAAAIARANGEPALFAQAALAYGLEITAALVDPKLVKLLEEALALLPAGDSPLRVSVGARLAAAMQPCADLNMPIGLARAAIASARRLGEPAPLLEALYTGMSAMMDIVDPAERLPLNLEVEQLAQQRGDAERLLRTQARLVFDYMELGDLAAADARIDSFERLAEQARATRYRWRAPLFRSMRAMMHGRFAESEALLTEARAMGESARDPQLERTLVFHREGLQRAWEKHAELIAGDPECRRMRLDLYSGPHWQNGGSAFTYARLEALDKARLHSSMIPRSDWPRAINPPAFGHLAEPLALVGAEGDVLALYELLLPARQRCVSWGWTNFIWDGPASRVLGLLAARLGRHDAAREHFEQAIALLSALDAGPHLARARYGYGRMLLQAVELGEAARARELCEAALADAERLGMPGLVELARRRLLPVRASQPAPPRTVHEPATERASKPPAVAADAAPTVGLAQDGEYWVVRYGEQSFRLRDSLGLRYLARLIAEPGRPLHVLELSGAGGAAGGALAGDSGELLDEQARNEYRVRLAELEQALCESENAADLGRAERLREERDFLVQELARGVGLFGRARRGGSATERARSAVQRRIKNALERIVEQSPALGAFLHKTVRTGNHCVYMPRAAAGAESE